MAHVLGLHDLTFSLRTRQTGLKAAHSKPEAEVQEDKVNATTQHAQSLVRLVGQPASWDLKMSSPILAVIHF